MKIKHFLYGSAISHFVLCCDTVVSLDSKLSIWELIKFHWQKKKNAVGSVTEQLKLEEKGEEEKKKEQKEEREGRKRRGVTPIDYLLRMS